MRTPAEPTSGEANAPGDEARWLALAAAGDTVAFGHLIRAHQGRVRQQLRRLTRGNEALADDLAQETFVQAWTHLPSFRREARLSTWLYSIAHSRFLMHQRSPAARHVAVALHENEDAPAAEDAAAPEPRVDLPALRHDLQRAVASLSDAEQRALYHCYQLDLSHQEAAAVLQWPLGTLKSHIDRAKTRLRVLLADWSQELP